MRRLFSWEMALVFLGDLVFWYASLWCALALRAFESPSFAVYLTHAEPFTYLFLVWAVVFYISSLYEPHTVVFKSRLPAVILNSQAANALIGVLFFYLIPYFGITPKTVLFLDLLTAFVLITLWRIFGVPLLGLRRKERAVLIGSGDETRSLERVVNDNPLYPMKFITWVDAEKLDGIDFEGEVLSRIYAEDVSTVVIDLKNEKVAPIVPKLYNLIFSHVRFVDQYRIYEDIFDKIPLSLIGYNWFLENISSRAHFGYDIAKRAIDIALALVLLIPTALVLPFVALAIRLEDGGAVFYIPERVGRGNQIFRIYKFRTMSTMDEGRRLGENAQRVTRVGAFLRKTRLDELPQLWNVLTGDLSLIGPRPEFPALVKEYVEQIPYYNMRHLITPGLSGWAQVHHEKPPQTVEETKEKLAYDLYYLKNRSLALDLKIVLKTIRTLLSRTGV
ncbi:MAG TPA: exopolysaccharide biosynthesis polyprenyl glycosylphosphotransferase [Candidatus Paceibacterota bacterium]|nr:exopolysaccharide biosynthesis polyprenyl glycosylphosphotransferase [Candidatus Paceibacterota bacterium]